MDLKFPHHENEIAQSCGATGKAFANYWLHNGFVNVDSEKMSKSLGNFFTLREVLPHLRHPEVLRYFLVASHYRGPINYTLDKLQQADATLGGLYNALRGAAAGGCRRGCGALARASSAKRWTTTSTRPRRWRCCSNWRARSTNPRRQGEPAAEAAELARRVPRAGCRAGRVPAGSGAVVPAAGARQVRSCGLDDAGHRSADRRAPGGAQVA